MISTKKIIDRIINLPLIIICLAMVKLPIFNKYKLHLLSTWWDEEKRNKIDNFLFRVFFGVWIRFEYLKENNPDKREILKSICMGGESGKNWAEFYQNQYAASGHEGAIDFNSKLGHMSVEEAYPIFNEISAILGNTSSRYLVIQVGSSSGREIAYFAKMFPQHDFVGTDIYDEIVEYASQCHNHSNSSFVKCPAKEIGNLLNKYNIDSTNRPVLIYSSGSLQLVQPEHLTIFFNCIGKYKNFEIVILDAGNESKGKPDEIKTSIFRGNFSYTHDYKWYAEESGIETVKCEIIRLYYPYENFPMHENTVHYFYSGKTK